MERGPRYQAYAELRESKLRMKNSRPQSQDHEPNLSPPKKQVKFQGNFPSTPPNRRKGSSVLAQSVPDFSSALRKENRRPASALPPVAEKSLTPPLISKREKKFGGSRSAEKRSGGGGVLARKSYASMEELKGFFIGGSECDQWREQRSEKVVRVFWVTDSIEFEFEYVGDI
ncbi:hypothetical protein Acr_05g0004220 [Actinidia rufa]|uniref:Uncharacterized protein n=1 Tax=Actinidia rufa TaxID=165716 RepID=A0A7J0EJY5_9ERIC|nr:hypothetical protein Acr_05g0004220 [Actinidia rufa]